MGDLGVGHRYPLGAGCRRDQGGRLLGSLPDAEDVLQETLLAAWRGLDTLRDPKAVRAWLYRIATNRCLNAARDASRRVRAEPVPPFRVPEPTRRDAVTWLDPYPDRLLPEAAVESRETVELAFVTALQRMPPRQAAVLLLSDVLGFERAEVAGMLGTGEGAVKGALQRARAAVEPRAKTLAPGSADEQRIAREFADAFTAGDVRRVVSLLTDDAWLRMPPAPHEYFGRPAIADFLEASAAYAEDRGLTLTQTRANTQPAFVARFGAEPAGFIVLTTAAAGLAGITRFHGSHTGNS